MEELLPETGECSVIPVSGKISRKHMSLHVIVCYPEIRALPRMDQQDTIVLTLYPLASLSNCIYGNIYQTILELSSYVFLDVAASPLPKKKSNIINLFVCESISFIQVGSTFNLY